MRLVSMQLESALRENRRRGEFPPAARLRALRLAAGLSQEIVARAVGVNRSCIALYEGGVRRPRGRRLEKYLRVLRRIERAVGPQLS